jgi:sulfur-carrier protein adenylyltransferase/sulfurtransferase
MPDVIALWQIEARAAISAYVEKLPGGHELSHREVSLYPKRRVAYGWEVSVHFPDKVRRLHILIDDTFPFSAARIALVDRPEFLTWPHVEEDGVLCLHSDAATWNIREPVGVVQTLFQWASELVTACILSENQSDFIEEFNSYWGWAASDGGKRIKSLLSLDNPVNRKIAVWRGKTQDIVGETPLQIKKWLTQRFSKNYKAADGQGMLIWLGKMPIPRYYPRTANDLLRLLGEIPTVLTNHIIDQPEELTLILASVTSNGIALAGISIQRRRHNDIRGRRVDSFNRGFRPGHVPSSLVPARYFTSHAALSRHAVDRIDHSWIHGRDTDPDAVTIKNGRVIIIGCGSLGGPVAVSLAQAGVGSIVLIDPDDLNAANISRHPLGTDDIGNNKAEALAAKLLLRFPHLKISAISRRIQEAASEYAENFKNSVVINATGDWAALVFLETYLRSFDNTTKFFTCWLEANASAGHAIFSPAGGPSVSCAFSSTGESVFRVSCWPENTASREPACGAAFSPYGAADTLNSVSLTADLAIDLVCNRVQAAEHRIWVGEFAKIARHGGTWSTYWRQHAQFCDQGGVLVSKGMRVTEKNAGDRNQQRIPDDHIFKSRSRTHDEESAKSYMAD